jgi:selenide,water dikinase
VLSKPLGAGVAATALKRGSDPDGSLIARATDVMCELNRDASHAARAARAHALTDVTGFGMLGHLHELAHASGVAAEVEAEAIPAIDGVLDLLRDDPHVVAGGTRRNREYAETFTSFADGVEDARRWLACDAMTSGGLLAAVPAGNESLAQGVVVGRLVAGQAGSIRVI